MMRSAVWHSCGGATDHEHDQVPEHAEPMSPGQRDHLLDELLHPDQFVNRIQETVEHRVVPAWKRHTEGEHRFVHTVAVIVAVGLIVTLPARVSNRPRLLLPSLALTLLIALLIASPKRLHKESKTRRTMSRGLDRTDERRQRGVRRATRDRSDQSPGASASRRCCWRPGRRSG